MTTCSLPARTPRRLPPLLTTSVLVGALLLLFGPAPFAAAAGAPLPAKPSTVEGTVSKVTGPILDLIEGGIQIDVTSATITGGDDRLATPLPWSGILVGSRVLAQVTAPDAFLPVAPPPPLSATSVVVFQTRAGALSGTIQSVDVKGGTFTMLFRTVSTNAGTKWSGGGATGTVKGIGELTAGMFAIVAAVNSGGLLATTVEAYGVTPPALLSWRGPVEMITQAAWMIASRSVRVDSDTEIVGSPGVGDIVDVVARVQDPPSGTYGPSGPSFLVAVSITKTPSVTPPPPGSRATEFDGIVSSIPASPTANGTPLGHWRISSRDVVVNGLTRIDAGIVVGPAGHVKGSFVMASPAAGSLLSMQFVASEIRKE